MTSPSESPPPLAGGGWGEGVPPEHAPSAPKTQLQKARALRREATPAERKLWAALRNHAAHDLKFRRQVPIGPYIADFYCPAARLVIELDGVSHWDATARDAVRDAWMRRHGLRVLRIPNAEIFRNLEGVVRLVILEAAGQDGGSHAAPPPPIPLPRGEGGR
ncbi:MAG: endonuclease domain-containing protein [Rhodospirillales bacterium]|nr:endonuclease domain-containing protein [Rhodospirillales bacterium]MBN8926026.1 endonuclease domain-containing protein [Rhodospirillales bacterium]